MAKYRRLHDAIKVGDLTIVKCLVKQGVDVNVVCQQETAFTRAAQCKNFKCVNIIMSSKKFDPNAGNQFQRTPLFMAAKLNRPDIVRRLLEMGARVNDTDIRGVTPLGACAWYDSHECAEILIQRGANIDQPDSVSQTPLYRACSNVSKNVVQVLLDHSCDVNLSTCDRKTPLMAALPAINNMNAGKTLTDMLGICEMLVANGCDIDAQDENGRTALHHTIESNDVYGMVFLGEHGCNLELKDNIGYTAFQMAIMPRRPRYELARYLLHLGTDPMKRMLNPDEHDMPTILPIIFLVNSRPNKVGNESDRMSRTLLLRAILFSINPHTISSFHFRCRYEHMYFIHRHQLTFHDQAEVDVINFIKGEKVPDRLQNQIRIKIRERLGNSNLVAKIDTLPICPPLKRDLNLGSPCRVASLQSICQLHMAIRDGHNDIANKLLEEGTSPDIVLQHKNALTLAIEVGNKDIAMMLMRDRLKETKDPSKIITPSLDTALHIAAKFGRPDIVKEMIKLGCNINVKNIYAGTPLQLAFTKGHLEVATILLKHGAIATSAQGRAPVLHLAAAAGCKEIVGFLWRRGCDINSQDIRGYTPLHLAASRGTQYLYLNIGVPFLCSDKTSELVDYVLMRTTSSAPALTKKYTGHLETVEFLLEKGANVYILDDLVRTALTYAEEIGDADIIKAIKKAS